jgi:serine/threonine-protein kinase
MGMVFRARQVTIGQTVALKMIRDDRYTGEHALARFKTEGAALARLKHQNVVQLYDFGEHDGLPYYTMELIAGRSLEALLYSGSFSPLQSARLVRTLAEAVQYLHEAGVLHRDLKPSNVLVQPDGTPRITDFGLAKLLDTDGETPTGRATTETGAVLGTPNYMAPEQAEGRTRDICPATDVYALGGILYTALTRCPPFRGSNPDETRRLVCTTDPVPPSRLCSDCPCGLEGVCLKCLEKRTEERYRTAKELATALTACLEGRAPPGVPGVVGRVLRSTGITRRRAIALGVGSVSIGGGVLGYRWWTDPERPILHELAADRKVMLIPKTGLPRLFTIRTGDERTQTSIGSDGTFLISSMALTLIELVPRVPSGRYRLTVQIRHDDSDVWGGVGIYCSGQAVTGGPRQPHLFAGVSYNDFRSAAMEAWLRLKPEIRAKTPRPDKESVGIGTGVAGDYDIGKPWEYLPRDLTGVKFDLAGMSPVWRTVELTVTPDEFSASWQNQVVRTITAELANEWLTDRVSKMRIKHPNNQIIQGIHAQYNPSGPLGLIVFRGTASFRNAEITPLNE